MRIEITGIIGSGKSSLAKLLLEDGFSVVFEEFKLNPFWKAFYSNPNKYNFETEVTFLLQHYHELKRKMEEENKIGCDFCFKQDLAYAIMGLNNDQLSIFQSIYEYTLNELGEPDLIVHMQCSPEQALKRIRTRGRQEEQLISEEFLSTLQQFIMKQIHTYSSTNKDTKLLEIDTEKFNIVTSTKDQSTILNKIRQLL